MSSDSTTDWDVLERQVRTLASFIWNRPADRELVAGVALDCVLKVEPDYWVCVEVTKSKTLQKLREDLAKFGIVRPALHAKGIALKSLFVTESDPSNDLKESAKALFVEALSREEFSKKFFDFASYRFVRTDKPFGSAVRPDSGQNDASTYVPVRYRSQNGTELGIDDLVSRVATGRKVVLVGQFGTGKSRCVKEVFSRIAEFAAGSLQYPIAVNLRDNWGVRRGHEIIRRHFDDLGLSEFADPIIRVLDRTSVVLLLDGFDEMASQSWSDDQAQIRKLRSDALAGVRDLLGRTKGGALITGREHYFNSNEEMMSALGLNASSADIVFCRSEFTDDEMKAFLGDAANDIRFPEWLPKRPLLCQTIASFPRDELRSIFGDVDGDAELWDRLMNAICSREARINPVLDAEKIREILRLIARATRSKSHDVGPVSISEINDAFEEVTGTPPVDESAVILQRLPGLGRTSYESSDREFIDKYILDGLRGIDVVRCLDEQSRGIERESWSNPLQTLGQRIVASDIQGSENDLERMHSFLRLAKRCAQASNRVLAGDIAASILRANDSLEEVDYGGFSLEGAFIGALDFSSVLPVNLFISDSVIEEIVLPAAQPKGTRIRKCQIGMVRKVSSVEGMPNWIEDSSAEKFESISTVSKIKEAELTPKQKVLVAIVKKTFLQKGSARKEEALVRGLGRVVDSGEVSKILNMLVREQVLERVRGDEGALYVPVRSQTSRMKKMLSELSLSADQVWKYVSETKK
ncbi:hypothetical protein JRI60_13140 [Archangium violaceum]|uniref:hypothetical protein n=1 Tax=Archangium violaceum TaxID=83451 RepID=UPI00195240BB|nr:hypothetical protein [Archangium violaceum]QRN99901.1 hypothetical protein JRI60_13140 [Archangium violaceum]